LVRTGPDLLVAREDHSARALKAAASKIPVVFVEVGDPLAAGLVASVPRPGGNVTGVSGLATELTAKRLEILKATFPGVRRVWAVYGADDLSSGAAARKAQEVAAVLKLDVVAQAVRTREELVSHLKTLRSGDALLAPPGLTLNIPGVILDLALMSRWPALFSSTFWVQAGALVSYGSDPHAEGVQAARLVARILRGERPQDLPVEGANKIELAINPKTARSLGITFPRDILVRPTESSSSLPLEFSIAVHGSRLLGGGFSRRKPGEGGYGDTPQTCVACSLGVVGLVWLVHNALGGAKLDSLAPGNKPSASRPAGRPVVLYTLWTFRRPEQRKSAEPSLSQFEPPTVVGVSMIQ
jgi:putative ABC transport system substrate-binding protein